MKTLYSLLGRIALACGVAVGLSVLGAMAWAHSDSNVTSVVASSVANQN